MQHEPIERRRPVTDDRIRKAVELLVDGPADAVRLAVGEPVHVGADENLDVRAGPGREGRALEATLTAPDDDHPARAVALVVLEIGREPDPLTDRVGERWRRIREGDCAHRHHHGACVHLRASLGRDAISAVGPALDRGHLGRILVDDVGVTEPGGVAEELLERNRLLPGLSGRGRPAFDRAHAFRRRERRLVPVRAEKHVLRHARPPRLHRLTEESRASTEVRGDGEAIGPGADDRRVDALSHDWLWGSDRGRRTRR